MKVIFREQDPVKVVFREDDRHTAHFSEHIEVPVTDWYDGAYSATPSSERQEIPVTGKTMRQAFIVEPIPSNYGLITWNGSTLTVS